MRFWDMSPVKRMLLSVTIPSLWNVQVSSNRCIPDFENGCRVTNEMILEQKGISEEEYIEELKESVRGMFDDIVTIPEGMETELDVDEMLAHTLNRLDMEQPMFINQYGEIVTIVQIDLVAGAGYNNYLAVTFSEK